MVECGCRTRFLLESKQPVCVIGERTAQHFDSHLAIQSYITRAPDFTHTAGAELRGDLIGSESCTGSEAHQTCCL